QPVGTAAVSFEDRASLGHLIADSLLEGGKPSGAVVAFMNSGGVRANLEAGTITYGQASSILPFRNTLVLLDLTGAEIEAALGQLAMYPSAGSSYRMVGGKPQDIVIAGAPLDRAKVYRVATLSFLAAGGDSVFAFRDAKGARTDTGKLDIDLWVEYLRAHPNLRPLPRRTGS
ncbi:MAG: multifunctional 2',3'-cyclic-nucleotide 2'-phosphodiesterase/5'-nucleotidase/3'-nucleotidase, partial [Armatimonadota bacterium]